MKIERVALEVAPAVDAQGARVAVEETPAIQRIDLSQVPVWKSEPIRDPNNPPPGMPERIGLGGHLRQGAEVAVTDHLGSFANAARERCELCGWYDQETWRQNLDAWKVKAEAGNREAQSRLAKATDFMIRALGPEFQADTKPGKTARALKTEVGICKAFHATTYRTSRCPPGAQNKFRPISREAKRVGEAAYDGILKDGEAVSKKAVGK